MKLYSILMGFLNKVSQRVPKGIGGLSKSAAAYPPGPGFRSWLVVGIGRAANLEEDGVKAGRGCILDNFVNFGRIGRGTAGGPIKAGDPQPTKLNFSRLLHGR
jgi:hypothetical protein